MKPKVFPYFTVCVVFTTLDLKCEGAGRIHADPPPFSTFLFRLAAVCFGDGYGTDMTSRYSDYNNKSGNFLLPPHGLK